jgi:hypothetical protein
MNESYSAESILSQIHEGMTVYDAETRNIGTVSDIYLGSDYPELAKHDSDSPSPEDNGATTDSVMAAGYGFPVVPVPLNLGATGIGSMGGVLPAFAFEDAVPPELRSHLMEKGFIQIRGNGILGASRYVTADQIAAVQDEAVYLSVSREQLNQSQ